MVSSGTECEDDADEESDLFSEEKSNNPLPVMFPDLCNYLSLLN